MTSTVFLWAALGLALLVAELAFGTVYLLAWAAGAGAAAAVQWLTGSWPVAAAVAAGVTGAGSLWARRVRGAGASAMADPDTGGQVSLVRPLGGDRWRVSYRGAEWDARLEPPVAAQAGDRATIVGREANLLLVSIS